MAYQPKNELVNGRSLKVQRLSIPFDITASATSANVVLHNDEPGFCFIASQGNDQITAAVSAAGDTATYTVSPNDANGICNFYINLNEAASKLVQCNVFDRVNGGSQPAKLGDADGLSTLGNLMVTMDSTVNHATTNFAGCLVVEYIISE